MSGSRLVRNSPDLARLVDEGYTVRIINGYLVVDDIPYVDADMSVQWGSFLCPLDLVGDQTVKPSSHVMGFVGTSPCNKDGQPLADGFANPGLHSGWSAGSELTASLGFSQKPRPDGYWDYHEKVTTYAAILLGPAQALDPTVTPRKFKPLETDEDDGVFVYLDTFSSRAGITARNQVLALKKVVIVGLGGTGGYLLDLLAKTPILDIHLYDNDVFGTHNAFRAPGAASLTQLQVGMKKVDYYATTYAAMRRRVHPHPVNVTRENVGDLLDADFVFLAMDSGPAKQTIIEALVAAQVRFVDTGVGVSDDPGGIAGQIRITTSTPGRSDHIARDRLISTVAGNDAEYDTNLQVAELNMAAALFAVLRFKKLMGFYADEEDERHSVFRLDTNEMFNRYGTSDPARVEAAVEERDTAGKEDEAA
ncbi:ThiF family adenylyltransferase [Rhodococcus pyridinivorans]|uniref:ThiF family adenylyltransferase n=1 Tax=Rhodococcus pyridinivorans TaxID=103816 RepID=UPI0036A81E3D